jgi:hypothetical protein
VTATPSDDLIEAQTQRGLAARLLAQQRTAQLAHLSALAALMVLLWHVVPRRPLLVWAGAIVLAIATRAAIVRWARVHQPVFSALRRRIRVAMAATGLAWGLGAAALLGDMPPESGILVLAVLGTLVAGAGSTLAADAVTFRVYAVCMLLPEAAGMLILAQDRPYVVAALLVVCVTVFMVIMNTEANRNLVDRLRTAAALEDALANVKTLRGLLPICASCKRIRDDRGYWSQIEVYVRTHSEADFSHSLCPDCARRLYPDLEVAHDSP